jgi:hypothetical protein
MGSFGELADPCLRVLLHNNYQGLETIGSRVHDTAIQKGYPPTLRQPVLRGCLGLRHKTLHERDRRCEALKFSWGRCH